MMPEDTIQEDTTSTVYIKQEAGISTSMSNKPEKYTDVLTDVIDMTMKTTRVPIKKTIQSSVRSMEVTPMHMRSEQMLRMAFPYA